MIFSCTKAMGQGDLLVSPLRIVFQGSKKSQEVNLANVGKDTASFAVSIINIRMKEDGGFEEIDTPDAGQNFADKYIRFFPRRVTLAPGEAQTVKVQLIKTGEMTTGEYRSHLYFRSIPEEKPLGEPDKPKDTTSISISLVPIFGITTPVIVRVGETSVDITLSDLSLEMVDDKTPRLSITFNRTGNQSAYGDAVMTYISPNGKETQVKLVKGIGVYTPNTVRHAKFDLDNDKNIDFHKGKIHVTYSMETANKTVKPVEAELELK